jgi:glycosyltransferase involved in cell wall biosynthesis
MRRDAPPTVSVVMKAYNHAPYVAAAVRSVLEQTFEDFELVITDDASTDGTPQVVDAFDDPRIRFERLSANVGITTAMRLTVARARGEFLAILNSDDLAYPGRLERQVAQLRARQELGAVFSIPDQIGEDGGPDVRRPGLFTPPLVPESAQRTAWLRHFFFIGNFLCAPSAMIRRAAYDAIGPDDPRLFLLMDLERWTRLLERYEIFVDPEPSTAYRWHGTGNASAAPENAVRADFEKFQLFKRVRRWDAALLRAVFAPDIAALGIDTQDETGVWLAEVALHGPRRWHTMFALETLYEAAREPRHYARLKELTGLFDAFGADRFGNTP